MKRELRRKLQQIGFFQEELCPFCGQKTVFMFDKFDSICCIDCDVWLEEKCSDPNCEYCSKRPDTPSEALFYANISNQCSKDWRRNNYQHKKSGEERKHRKLERLK